MSTSILYHGFRLQHHRYLRTEYVEDLPDDIPFLNEGYDPQGAGALGADQRINFISPRVA